MAWPKQSGRDLKHNVLQQAHVYNEHSWAMILYKVIHLQYSSHRLLCRQVTMETKASSPKVRWRAWRQAAAKAAYTRADAKDRGLHCRCQSEVLYLQ